MPIPDALLDRTRGWVTLDSGLELFLELPSATNMVNLGGMSWPLIAQMQEVNRMLADQAKEALDAKKEEREPKPPEPISPELREGRRKYQRALVAGTIRKAKLDNGMIQELSIDPDADPDELRWLETGEFYEVFAYAEGYTPLRPRPTPPASPDSSSQTTEEPTPSPALPSESIQPGSSETALQSMSA